MDEYNDLENVYFGKVKIDNKAKEIKTKGLYEYVNLLNPPKNPSPHVNYRLLIELANIFKEERNERVMKKLLDYGVIKNEESEINELITLAGNFADEFDQQEKLVLKIDANTKKGLAKLAEILGSDKEPEDIQNTIYQIAKANDIPPRDFFKILYQIILGTSRGPKIGPFIEDIGRKKVGKILSSHL